MSGVRDRIHRYDALRAHKLQRPITDSELDELVGALASTERYDFTSGEPEPGDSYDHLAKTFHEREVAQRTLGTHGGRALARVAKVYPSLPARAREPARALIHSRALAQMSSPERLSLIDALGEIAAPEPDAETSARWAESCRLVHDVLQADEAGDDTALRTAVVAALRDAHDDRQGWMDLTRVRARKVVDKAALQLDLVALLLEPEGPLSTEILTLLSDIALPLPTPLVERMARALAEPRSSAREEALLRALVARESDLAGAERALLVEAFAARIAASSDGRARLGDAIRACGRAEIVQALEAKVVARLKSTAEADMLPLLASVALIAPQLPGLGAPLAGLLEPGRSLGVRWRAAEALGAMGPLARDAVGALIEALASADVAKAAAQALGAIGAAAEAALPALERAAAAVVVESPLPSALKAHRYPFTKAALDIKGALSRR